MVREDKKLYDWIIRGFGISRNEMKDNFDNALLYHNVYKNKMWNNVPGMSRPDDLTQLAIPLAEDVVEVGLSVATARTPRPTIEPEFGYDQVKTIMAEAAGSPEELARIEAEGGEEGTLALIQKQATQFADALVEELIKFWRKNGIQGAVRNAFRGKSVKGSSLLKIWKDKDGQIKKEACDYESILPAPGVYTLKGHTNELFIYAPIRTVNYVKRYYGVNKLDKNAIMTKPECEKIRHPDAEKFLDIQKVYTTIKVGFNKLTGNTVSDRYGFCIPLQAYMPADPEIDVEEYDEDQYIENNGELEIDLKNKEVKKQTVTKTRAKFPSGYKCVTVIYGNKNMIIDEEDCPYAPEGVPQPPFVKISGYLSDDSFHGVSEVEKITDLIAKISLTASNMMDIVRLTGNAPLVIAGDTYKQGDALASGEEELGDTVHISVGTGDVIREQIPGSTRFLYPGTSGQDAKWLLEWFMAMLDRITHLGDAVRGFNKYSQDSGRKIRELRAAATGTFGPKMDEVTEFCTDIYKMLAWIYINMLPDAVILQKDDMAEGYAQFNKFKPSVGKMFKFNIDVSARALLPEDQEEYLQIALTLYNTLVLANGEHAIPEEVVVKHSTLPESQSIIKHIAEKQEELNQNAQKQAVAEQFKEVAGQSDSVTDPEEGEQLSVTLTGMIQQVPELLFSELFMALKPNLKDAIIETIRTQTAQGDQNVPQPKVQ